MYLPVSGISGLGIIDQSTQFQFIVLCGMAAGSVLVPIRVDNQGNIFTSGIN